MAKPNWATTDLEKAAKIALTLPRAERNAYVRNYYAEHLKMGRKKEADHWFVVLSIMEHCSEQGMVVNMSTDNSVNIGGDNSGIAAGQNAKVQARDIVTYKNFLGQSGSIGSDLSKSFVETREAIEDSNLPATVKNDMLRDHDSLTEAVNNKEDKSTIKYFLAKVMAFGEAVKNLEPFLKLGELLNSVLA